MIPHGYCHCGCGEKTNVPTKTRPGWVRGVPVRFIQGHGSRMKGRVPASTRVWRHVSKGPSNACWLWTAALNTKGYGSFKGDDETTVRAHRFIYELLVGPVPEGLELDHLCRNRVCVNPAHLEPVDHRENTLRGVGFGGKNARKTHCPQGHPYEGDNLIVEATTGRRRCRICTRETNAKYRAKKRSQQ
jgi:hypothetical protein